MKKGDIRTIDGVELKYHGKGEYSIGSYKDTLKLIKAHKVRVFGEGTEGHWVRVTNPNTERKTKIRFCEKRIKELQETIASLNKYPKE